MIRPVYNMTMTSEFGTTFVNFWACANVPSKTRVRDAPSISLNYHTAIEPGAAIRVLCATETTVAAHRL